MTGIVFYERSSSNQSVSKLLCEAVLKLEIEITGTGCVLMQSKVADFAKKRSR
jgi:hypothetical protein